MNILIIDDNIEIIEILEMALLEKGHSVLMAENGAKGLQVLEKEKVELVISDIQMPVMDGFQFLLTARSLFGPELPIILVTGSSPYTQEQIYKAGASGYFEKPYDLDNLLDGIKTCA